VAKHNSASSCWSVVNGKVYDLTSYVSSHPGGSSVIKAICGKDGTAAFSGQHAGAARPNNTLDGFLLGTLASSSAGTTPLQPAPAQVGGEEGEEEEEGEGHD
jgi:cytochrome b involved in lipid metabolism